MQMNSPDTLACCSSVKPPTNNRSSGDRHLAWTADPQTATSLVPLGSSREEDSGVESRLSRGSSHTNDLKISTPTATLPGAWRYRVSAGTGWPDVSTLFL